MVSHQPIQSNVKECVESHECVVIKICGLKLEFIRVWPQSNLTTRSVLTMDSLKYVPIEPKDFDAVVAFSGIYFLQVRHLILANR